MSSNDLLAQVGLDRSSETEVEVDVRSPEAEVEVRSPEVEVRSSEVQIRSPEAEVEVRLS